MYGIIMACLLSNNTLWSVRHIPAVVSREEMGNRASLIQREICPHCLFPSPALREGRCPVPLMPPPHPLSPPPAANPPPGPSPSLAPPPSLTPMPSSPRTLGLPARTLHPLPAGSPLTSTWMLCDTSRTMRPLSRSVFVEWQKENGGDGGWGGGVLLQILRVVVCLYHFWCCILSKLECTVVFWGL